MYTSDYRKKPINLFFGGGGGGGGWQQQMQNNQQQQFQQQQFQQQQFQQQMQQEQQFAQQYQDIQRQAQADARLAQDRARQEQEKMKQQQIIGAAVAQAAQQAAQQAVTQAVAVTPPIQQQPQPLQEQIIGAAVAQAAQQAAQQAVTQAVTQPTQPKPLQVKPIVAPLCILKKGTTKGETIITNIQSYTCPEGTTIYCPNDFTIKTDSGLNVGCEWTLETDQPNVATPTPNCKPNEARTIITNTCMANEITEQTCTEGQCIRQDGPLSDCLCADPNFVVETVCRLLDDRAGGELIGTMNCEDYGVGYEVGCPDGYVLNSAGDMCNFIS